MVEQLKDQMAPCFSLSMHVKLFHKDFKFHIEAVAILTNVGAVKFLFLMCVHLVRKILVKIVKLVRICFRQNKIQKCHGLLLLLRRI